MRLATAALALALLLLASREARAADDKDGDASNGPYVKVETGGTTKSSQQKKVASRDETTCDAESDDACGCSSHCCWHRHGSCREPSVSLEISGLRPSLTHVSAGGQTTNEVGAGFAVQADSYALDGTTHANFEGVIGGGQAAFDGKLAGVLEVGYRLDVTDHQGPFGRVGFDGRLQGNDAYYFSALELPRMSLGWQFASRRAVLELGGRTGPILTGRFNPSGGVRHTTGAWEYGLSAAAQIEFLRFEGTAMRIDARSTGDHTPVDVGRGAVCAVAGRLGICGDFMAIHGSADFGGPLAMQDALATYAGVTVGFSRW